MEAAATSSSGSSSPSPSSSSQSPSSRLAGLSFDHLLPSFSPPSPQPSSKHQSHPHNHLQPGHGTSSPYQRYRRGADRNGKEDEEGHIPDQPYADASSQPLVSSSSSSSPFHSPSHLTNGAAAQPPSPHLHPHHPQHPHSHSIPLSSSAPASAPLPFGHGSGYSVPPFAFAGGTSPKFEPLSSAPGTSSATGPSLSSSVPSSSTISSSSCGMRGDELQVRFHLLPSTPASPGFPFAPPPEGGVHSCGQLLQPQSGEVSASSADAGDEGSDEPASHVVPPPEDQAIRALLADIRSIAVDDLGDEDEEKMWVILHTLEEWKKSQETVLRNQQLISEIKAALLPLIAALNRPKVPIGHSELPSLQELARFNDQFKLVLNTDNWHRFRADESYKNSLSNIIAVLGDTHVGKSTIVGALIREEGATPGDGMPPVAEPHQNAPTTCNVNIYNCERFVDDSRAIFMDLEGENGGQPPRSAITERLMTLLNSMGVTEYQDRRRRAVADNLSRLAFVTSDVVIFIWNESFANASYMQRVRKLALASTESVDSASGPALVLIYNKCGLDEEFDIEKCTASFFENEENEEIRRLYSEVYCVCIPHMDQMKKIRSTKGKPPMLIDGEEIFSVQIRKLKTLLKSLVERRMSVREQNGMLFSFHVWFLLFRFVVERFEQKLRMAEILTIVLQPDNEMVSQVFKFFADTYHFSERRDTATFLRCREAAIQMLAVKFVDHLRSKQEEMDKFIIHSFKSESLRLNVTQMFIELIKYIDKITPCSASLQFQDGSSVGCTQEKMCHGLIHRTSQRVYCASSSDEAWTRVFQNMKGWLRIGYCPSWPGKHQFQYPLKDEGELAKFQNNIEILSRALPSSYFLCKIAILQKALLDSSPQQLAKNNWTHYCWICLKNLPDRVLIPCRHILCAGCLDQAGKVLDGQVAIGLQEDTPQSFGVLRSGHCPVCDVPIKSANAFRLKKSTSTLSDRLSAIVKVF